MDNLKWKQIKLGDCLTLLTDYHSNGSYKVLKENATLVVNLST